MDRLIPGAGFLLARMRMRWRAADTCLRAASCVRSSPSLAFFCGVRGNLPESRSVQARSLTGAVCWRRGRRRCAGLVMGMFVAFGNAFLKTKRKSDSWDWAVHARSLAGAVRWQRGCRRCAGLAVGMFAAFKRFPRGDDPSLELYR